MLARLTIASRLLVLIGALVAGSLFVGAFGIHAMREGQHRSDEALQRKQAVADAVIASRAAQVAFKLQVQEWKDTLLRGYDPKDYDSYMAAFHRRDLQVGRELDTVAHAMAAVGLATDSVEEARRLHAQLDRDYQEALQHFDVRDMQNTHAIDRMVRGKDRPIDTALEHIVVSLQDFGLKETARIATLAAEQARRAVVIMSAVMLAVLAAGLLLGLALARSISRPLRQAVAASRRVAAGDLTVQLDSGTRDELGLLLAAMSEMSAQLRAVLGEVVTAARSVADTSTQLAQGNLDLSQRTEEQASTLEETASQMEELTSTVSQNADHARQANEVAADAAEAARKGGAVVGNVVSTMAGISESSRRIGDIIGVIDAIAFQTNILALNAAVEAARAGEQGRGFAVVASEVRSLAQRSAAAAKEIKLLISDSTQKVDAGAELVDRAGSTMQEIVAAVRRVSEIVGDIAAASLEQSAGIEQVNTAVTQMDHVVQQNASLVEEATAATESMKAQAFDLLRLVSRFRLGDSEAPAVARGGATSRYEIGFSAPLSEVR